MFNWLNWSSMYEESTVFSLRLSLSLSLSVSWRAMNLNASLKERVSEFQRSIKLLAWRIIKPEYFLPLQKRVGA